MVWLQTIITGGEKRLEELALALWDVKKGGGGKGEIDYFHTGLPDDYKIAQHKEYELSIVCCQNILTLSHTIEHSNKQQGKQSHWNFAFLKNCFSHQRIINIDAV